MTILDASNKLFLWFSERESFNINEHSDKEDFFESKKFSKTDLAALIGALDEFEKMEVIKKIEVDGQAIYILKKSFESFEQTIKFSPETCRSISEFINGFCDMIKNETDRCDVKNVTEKDVKNLLMIATNLLKLEASKEKGSE
jgi:hypothetical protein